MSMIKVGIIGSTGYTGKKLVELLLNHPFVEITYLSSQRYKNTFYSSIYPEFRKKLNLKCEALSLDKVCEKSDIIFLCVPHTTSMEITPHLLKKNKKVIDLSADYRIKNPRIYKKFYKVMHKDLRNLKKSVYGLPEFFKEEIEEADLVSNPGCYSTVVLLSILPLIMEDVIKESVFIDAKSGASGAGRKLQEGLLYCEVNENVKCYSPFVHRHIPEMEEVIYRLTKKTVKLNFVPHILPLSSGIMVDIYIRLKKFLTSRDLKKIYSVYSSQPFVRICEDLPSLKNVVGTNFCDIGMRILKEEKILLVVGVIDNLIKGAGGQAIQNMNIISGLSQTEGLM